MTLARFTAWATLLLLGVFVLWGPSFLPHPHIQDLSLSLQSPSLQHWLGMDALGRSALARLAQGLRTSIGLAVGAAVASALLGCILGIWAAWRQGWSQHALQGLSDGVMAMPALLWVLLLSAIAPGEKWPLYMGLVATAWVEFYRTTRVCVSVALASPQVQSSRLLGFGVRYIVRHHISPELSPRLFTLGALAVCNGVLAVAAMGFVGIGLRPPEAELGLLMTESLPYFSTAPHLLMAPVLALLACVLSLHTITLHRSPQSV